MSTDWIKMRVDLRTHPKVVRMASALKADKLRVIGGLFAVWSIFDAHAVDGLLEGYDFREIDEQLGWKGFASAMHRIEWLTSTDDGLNAPRFDEHNGQSAKRRAMETERKRQEREAEKAAAQAAKEAEEAGRMSALDADDERTREEKSRGKENTHTAGAALPERWMLTKAMREDVIAEFPHWTHDIVVAIGRQFVDHHRAAGTLSHDWDASWRKWCRDELTQRAHPTPKPAAAPVKAVSASNTVPSNGADQTQAALAERARRAAEIDAADTPEKRAARAAQLRETRSRLKAAA